MNTHPFPKSSAVSGSQRSIAAINSESVMVSPLVFGCRVRASIISPLGWPPISFAGLFFVSIVETILFFALNPKGKYWKQ